MIEIIKMLVDGLMKAIPAITQAKAKGKVKDAGASLFLIYIRLNEILVAADRIIHSLEVYVQRMERHLQAGDDAYALTAGNWISEEIEKQQVNLDRIAKLIHDSRAIFIIVDADSFVRLAPLLDRKGGALWRLSRLMRGGSLVLNFSDDQVKFLRTEPSHDDRFHLQSRSITMMSDMSGARIVRSADKWGEEHFRLVKEYLEERKPRMELARIQESVGALRTALLAQFSMDDLLLAAGDTRFDLSH